MSLFAKPLQGRQRATFSQWLRNGNRRLYQRARAILLSAGGRKVPELAEALGLHPLTIRAWLKAFNAGGCRALRPRRAPGRLPKMTPDVQRHLRQLLREAPTAHGIAQTRWTLDALRRVLHRQTGVKGSRFWVWQHLHRLGATYKRAKFWVVPRSARAVAREKSPAAAPGAGSAR
jgi:transposase